MSDTAALSSSGDQLQKSTSPDDLLHESRITPIQALILILCFVAYILDGFDIVIIAFAAPAISADLGVAPDRLGLMFSAGMLGMALGAMLLAPLADIYGRRPIASLMLLLAGLATLGVVYVETVPQLIALRLVAGLGLGALAATLLPWGGEYSPARYRIPIMSILFSGASLGPVLGGLITAPLIAEYGWRSIFQYAGLLSIFMAGLMYMIVPESMAYIIRREPRGALPKVNRILKYIGQHPIDKLPRTDTAVVQESALLVSLLTSRRRAMTLLIWSTFLLSYAGVYFLSSWVPQILVNAGFSQGQAIQGAVMVPLGSIFGTLLFGGLARWWPLNRILTLVFFSSACLMALLSSLLAGTEGAPTQLIWILLFVVGMTLMGGFGNLYPLAMTVYPAQVRSTGIGWATGLGRAGAVVSPMLAGFLMAMGVATPGLVLYFALPVLLAGGMVAFIRMKELP